MNSYHGDFIEIT